MRKYKAEQLKLRRIEQLVIHAFTELEEDRKTTWGIIWWVKQQDKTLLTKEVRGRIFSMLDRGELVLTPDRKLGLNNQ